MIFSQTMIVEREFLDHWKTHLLRQLTGLPNAAEIPLRIWAYCESNRSDFIRDDGKGLVITGICRVTCEPKRLLRSLLEARWLDRAEGGFVAHGWAEKNANWLQKIGAGRGRAKSGARLQNGHLATSGSPAADQRLPSGSPAADTPAGEPLVQWSRVEWSGEENPQSPPPRRNSASAPEGGGNPQILTETAAEIFRLIGSRKKRTRLGYEAEGLLSEHIDSLPLAAEDWEILRWWLSLPEDSSNPYLKAGSRPQDADRLAIRLFSELERAASHAQKLKKNFRPEAEPEGWRERMAQKFGEGVRIPARWRDVPEDIRARLTEGTAE
jgi:hypothetical protein